MNAFEGGNSLEINNVRERKKTKKKPSGGSGPPSVSCWPLFDQMAFIDDTVKHKMYFKLI